MKYIKDFNDFVLEAIRYRTFSGDTSKVKNRLKEYDVLYDEPLDAKSPSAGVLLKNKLKGEEMMDLFDKIPDDVKKEDLMHIPKKKRRLIILKNNTKFLKSEKLKGELRCEYCNEGPLRIYSMGQTFNEKDGATADHKIPISKGGDVFNFENLAVCCYKCNNKKADDDYETWIDKLKLKHGN